MSVAAYAARMLNGRVRSPLSVLRSRRNDNVVIFCAYKCRNCLCLVRHQESNFLPYDHFSLIGE